MDLESRAVMRFEQRQHETADVMKRQVRRDIADSQGAVGRAVVGMWRPALIFRLRDSPAPVFLKYRPGVKGWIEMQTIKHVINKGLLIRLVLYCPLIAC